MTTYQLGVQISQNSTTLNSDAHAGAALANSSRSPEALSPPDEVQNVKSPSTGADPDSVTPPESTRKSLEATDIYDAQYARYRPAEEGWNNSAGADMNAVKLAKGWVPVPLRAYFWIPLVISMILLAIGLEIALHLNGPDGWGAFSASRPSPAFANYYHYAYTEPPVIVGMVIVGLWAWVDVEMRGMQPYVDLVRGHAPPETSLLLDYTRKSKFVVWISAFWNRHYMVGIITLISLLALVFQPLSASLFILKPTWWGPSDYNVTNLYSVGLNEGPEFQSLVAFLSAAGYASSSVLYNLGDLSFIHDTYTVAPFEIPLAGGNNGTVYANTVAVKTDTNCHLMATISTPIAGGGWINNATFGGCTYSYSVGPTTSILFGTDVMPDCNDAGTPEFLRPIIFWFFTYDSTPPQGSATHCAPNISLWDVAVTVDIDTRNLTSVQEIRPFESSNNITGAPLNGQAFNGIVFNLTNPDRFAIERSNATDLQLPASILQAAYTAPGGLAAAFQTNSFVEMATEVYGVYLQLIAKTVYFLPRQDPLLVQVQSYEQRLFLSSVAVHLVVFVLLVIAFVGTIVQVLHRESRQKLRLQHIPGTLASAISIGAETNLAHLLYGQQLPGDFAQALRNRKFRIDPTTQKIVMEGEEGYENAVSPVNPRHSSFASRGLRSPSEK